MKAKKSIGCIVGYGNDEYFSIGVRKRRKWRDKCSG